MNITMILDNAFEPDVRVYKEALSFVQSGHNVEILCYDGRGTCLERPNETIDGINIKRFYLRSKIGTFLTDKISFKFHYFFYIIWFLKFYIKCKKYLKNKNIDYIYSHDLFCGIMSCIFFRKSNKVFDMHEIYRKEKKNHIYNNFAKRATKFVQNHSKFIIYVNEVQKNNVNKNLLEKFIYLPNYPVQKDYSIEKATNDRLVISYIGNIRRSDLIVNLCKAGEGLECDIKIYGRGLDDKYKFLIESIENANYYGSFNGIKEAGNLFSSCDLLYSVYDINDLNWKAAIPVKFFEAMASGTPVIASKDSNYGNLVKQENIGYVVEWDNCVELRDTIKNIILNKDDYMLKRNNCILIRKKYSWEGKINELINKMEK